MRYLKWLLRIAMFGILLGFAVKNDQPVVLRYFFGYEWQAPMVLVLLLFFAAGVGIGLFSGLSKTFWQRREISKLKKELSRKNKPADITDA